MGLHAFYGDIELIPERARWQVETADATPGSPSHCATSRRRPTA